MNALLAVIGSLVIVGVIALKIWPATRAYVKTKLMIGAIIGGLVMIGMSGAFFYAEAGYQYMVQYPTGHQTLVAKPGWNARFWGDVLPWKKELNVRLTEENDQNSETASAGDNSQKVLFNDGVRAKISTSLRFQLPTDEETFLKMVRVFRTEENLIRNALVPAAREVIRNSARELPAQRYISGGGGILENNIADQMENGIVMLTVKERTETPTEEQINPDTGEKRIINLKPVIVTEVIRKKDKNGEPQRKKSSLQQYNILVTQAIVDDVNFEPKFKKMIEQQRDAAARANVEKQKAKEAEYAQKRIVAEGEKNKAEKRAVMEMAQVEALITAETSKKKEEFAKQEAEIALQRAEIEAKNVRVRAQADADARKLKMQADGALEQKLDAWVEAQKAWAATAGQHRLVPDMVFGDSAQSGSADQFIQMMMANQARQLNVSVNP